MRLLQADSASPGGRRSPERRAGASPPISSCGLATPSPMRVTASSRLDLRATFCVTGGEIGPRRKRRRWPPPAAAVWMLRHAEATAADPRAPAAFFSVIRRCAPPVPPMPPSTETARLFANVFRVGIGEAGEAGPNWAAIRHRGRMPGSSGSGAPNDRLHLVCDRPP